MSDVNRAFVIHCRGSLFPLILVKDEADENDTSVEAFDKALKSGKAILFDNQKDADAYLANYHEKIEQIELANEVEIASHQ